ncbi:MAG: cohesin domain-containing protein [Patescibacteria group bacterium]|nr:cohesin domain-containing protein [Patescibacteria group bacterium]
MKEKLKLIFLFLFGVVLVLFAFSLSLNWKQWMFLPKKSEIERLVPKLPLSQKKTANAFLNFNPRELTVYQNQELKIEVLLESEAKIVGADLNFQFDPTILEIKEIKSGNFFSGPQEIKKIIETEKGRIFYSLASFSPRAGKGILAELIFTPKKPGSIEISLTKETQIAAVKIDEVKIDLPILGKYTILEINE